jgi:Flp pilus assembly protein TadG
MVRIPDRERKQEAGQAILLVVLAMSLFMLGALGFIIDGSHLYAQRTMAQAAADAAAQAGMMSIFDNTTGAWGAHTAGASFTCGTADTAAACKYAQSAANGFNLAGDVVTVTPNPAGVAVTGLSTADSVNLLEVSVQRTVKTTLMNLIGSSGATIKAVGIAAIVQIVNPTPILITHPTLSDALSLNGATSITICGGPSQSIEINSSSATAYGGGGTIDLSHAGPLDPGNCSTGTGASFGVFGGDHTNPGSVSLGTTGKYLSPSSPIQDPLAGVAPPAKPTIVGAAATCSIHCGSCPGGASTCLEYTPGLYATGLNLKGQTAMLDPGIYYLEDGGFTTKNSTVGMCAQCAADPTTVNGVLLYDTVTTPKTGTITAANCDATGGFAIDTNSADSFLGAGVSSANPTAAPAAPYYGIAFFEDRNACAQNHTLGQGNSCFAIIGTVYITNTLASMLASPALVQSVEFNGGTCSATQNYGEIIVGALTMKGNDSITMGLFPNSFLKIRQVALVD